MKLPVVGRLLATVGLFALLGCGAGDGVRSYTVPRTTEATKPAPVAPVVPEGEPKGRLLGAIIPVPNTEVSWFVKFSGSIAGVSDHEKAFDEFLATIRITDDPRTQPTYTAPPGWTEGARRQMRVVTFSPPAAKPGPDLYISSPFAGSLLENVNRWRDEVGVRRVTEAELPAVTKEVMLGTVKAYKVDFRGPLDPTGKKMGPFMGGR
jgi:hypothetical protein